jgi:hypothetical protein
VLESRSKIETFEAMRGPRFALCRFFMDDDKGADGSDGMS